MALADHIPKMLEAAKRHGPGVAGGAIGAALLSAYTHHQSKRPPEGGLSPAQHSSRELIDKYDERDKKMLERGEKPGLTYRTGKATARAVGELSDVFADHPAGAALLMAPMGFKIGRGVAQLAASKLSHVKEEYMSPEERFAAGLSGSQDRDEQFMARLMEMPTFQLEGFLKKTAGAMKKPAVRGETPTGTQPNSNVGDPQETSESAAIRNYDHTSSKSASVKEFARKLAMEKRAFDLHPAALAVGGARGAFQALHPMAQRAIMGGAAGAVAGGVGADQGHTLRGAVKGGLAGAGLGAASAHPMAVELANKAKDSLNHRVGSAPSSSVGQNMEAANRAAPDLTAHNVGQNMEAANTQNPHAGMHSIRGHARMLAGKMGLL